MIGLFIGLAIDLISGWFSMAVLSLCRNRDTQAVADAAICYVTYRTRSNWHERTLMHKLTCVVDQLAAE